MCPLRKSRSLGAVLFASAALFSLLPQTLSAQISGLWPRPLNNALPHIAEPLRGRIDSALVKTWLGLKRRNIDAYSVKLLHRPNSEQPHDAVSEGVGYGLLMAVFVGDQGGFNQLWDAAENCLFQGEYYDWRADKDGKRIGTGAATDADEDIAVALLFADALQRKGLWQAHKSPKGASYVDRAKSLMEAVWGKMIANGKYIKPGSGWGGPDQYNPSYFAPAWYRLFQSSGSNHDWNAVIDQGYKSLKLSPGYAKGLIPDWMKAEGGYAGALGYNAYGDGHHMYKDAIRVYWRLAIDALWFQETRGMEFMKNAVAFVKTPANCNFYTMEGQLVPDTFILGNQVSRPRAEHSHLTVSMWSTAILAASGATEAGAYGQELLKYYDGGDYWGKAQDAAGEDTSHNEMYFDQCLAWFGAATLTGAFSNFVDNLAHPVADLKQFRIESKRRGSHPSWVVRLEEKGEFQPLFAPHPEKSRQFFNLLGAQTPRVLRAE